MMSEQDREVQRAFDGEFAGETLQKLYLELANIVPKDCVSSREIRLGKIADTYGLALKMICEGVDSPREVAREALLKVKK